MTTASVDETASRGLVARLLGVIMSPRAAYAGIAARPRVLGALVAVILLSGGATFAFLSTEVGRTAALDRQLSVMESFGRQPTPEQVTRMEQFAPLSKYFALVSQIVFIPVVTLVASALILVVFGVAMGGEAVFKQIAAVVAHSWIIVALQTLFVLPLNYVRESLSSATSLAVFFPMLDDTSFAGLLLGSIDLFRIWWIVNLAIGIAVLYRRRTGPIAGGMLVIYGVIVLAIAGVRAVMSGA